MQKINFTPLEIPKQKHYKTRFLTGFTKMVASGNDFVAISLSRYLVISFGKLAKKICDRKFGVGADGLLILEKSKIADIKMRIFNPDGSEPQMCGNGVRCVAVYSARNQKPDYRNQIRIETKAGIIESEVNEDKVKIKLTEPQDIKLDIPIKINNRLLKVNFINTGVPHTVIFVEGLEKIAVANLGRQIRYHRKFKPQGTNVDFVEAINNNSLKVRTYERGVEAETLACGTGAVASALLYTTLNPQPSTRQINVITKGKETLKIYFERTGDNFKNVWLEGKVEIVYTGQIFI